MANVITLGRVVLLFVAIVLLYRESYGLVLLATFLFLVVFASDAIDGIVARRRGSASVFGAVFDIAGDRVVENALWIVFADLGAIGVWAPLLVMTRGFLVDGVRSVALGAGRTPFGEQTMQRSPVTRFLAASRFMRALYGVAKLVAFAFLSGLVATRMAAGRSDPLTSLYAEGLFLLAGWVAVYLTLGLTVFRGLPVLVDALPYLRAAEQVRRPEPFV
jgi:CDP-diacylglycerol--glycerol-3-phosphate 3-phosphatidyltransferase